MIPRYQTVLFVVLVVASVVMGVVLWQLRDRAHQRLLAADDWRPRRLLRWRRRSRLRSWWPAMPMARCGPRNNRCHYPAIPEHEHAPCWGNCSICAPPPTLLIRCPAARARLRRSSCSPRPEGRRSDQPGQGEFGRPKRPIEHPQTTGDQLAVVNLTGAFVAGHPSGIETETLTVLSICATLHANLPRVTQVRFLVDGQPRATLAGHADLTRTYLATEACRSRNRSAG